MTEPGVLDNRDDFLRDMAEVWEGNASDADLQEKMTQEDQRCTLSILLLALLLDGKMGAPERELFAGCLGSSDSLGAGQAGSLAPAVSAAGGADCGADTAAEV